MSNKLPPCKDFEVCGNESDPNFTMDFTDVKPGAYIYWCAECGKRAQVMAEAIQTRCKTEPGFAKKLENEINKYNN